MLPRLTRVSSVATQWEEVVVMHLWEVGGMVWEEALAWEVVATAWEEVMEWEDLLPGEREAPALEVWRPDLETGSAWSVRM